MNNKLQFIQFFRQAAPYIHRHRRKIFVFCIQDDQTTQANLKSLLHDIAILHALGVRVVIAYGARHTLGERLENQQFHAGKRITDAASIHKFQEIVGAIGTHIQAILSMGLANSPMQGASIQTVSGNFVIAKPLGVHDGIDFGLTGEVRKIRTDALQTELTSHHIPIIPPLGYSSTGEVFNLTAEAVAGALATALQADKLLFFSNHLHALTETRTEGQAITTHKAETIANQLPTTDTLKTTLHVAAKACQNGVNRAHIIPKSTDGAALAELFTRDGFGLMVTNEPYDRIEQATIDDIPSLLQLIRPLEKQGILVRRSRELLEIEIEAFSLMKRDSTVIGCAALYPYAEEKMGELGCVAVSPDYQKYGLADKLLTHIETLARDNHLTHLFCLTTHTSHWFMERGFEPTPLEALPEKKQMFYNLARNSKPYIKHL